MKTWYQLSVDDVLRSLQTSSAGLSSDNISLLQRQYGPNRLDTKKSVPPIVMFLRQFQNFIIYILFFALIISYVLGDTVDAIVIGAILVLNACIGFYQELQAERRIASLSTLVPHVVVVRRDGVTRQIPAVELVPGDIIELEEGSLVPADARVLDTAHVTVVESALTGESVPVEKHTRLLHSEFAVADQSNMVFSGTLIASGRLTAVVVATGMQTEFGKIATLLSTSKKTMTPLQRQLDVLGKKVGMVVVLLCIVILVYGMIREHAITILVNDGWVSFFTVSKVWITIALSLAVAAVPEGLPAVVTIALSIGVKKLAAKHTLIRTLSSVESLGETTVICTDKTGTLTQNKMTVQHLITPQTASKPEDAAGMEHLLRIGVLCNNAYVDDDGIHIGDPTETALLVASGAVLRNEWLNSWQRVDEFAFDSKRKSMSTIDTVDGNTYTVHTKGAVERILGMSSLVETADGVVPMTDSIRTNILATANQYASQGMRLLACAMKEVETVPRSLDDAESALVFVGMHAMIDPPHPQVPAAIETCKRAGIRVIMITGDNPLTATEIGKQIGITGDTIRGDEFMVLDEAEQQSVLKRVQIFARVSPEHKYHIVDLLQRSGEIVAMTGDGVNDAPAIKKADFGIAMGINGTDVAKEASDMILLDDNFTTIVEAIEEGRNIYQNIRKVVNFLLSSNAAEIGVILLALVFGLPLPLTAIMLLWINLVTDGMPALAMAVDPDDTTVMHRAPKSPKESFLPKQTLVSMGIAVVLIISMTLGVFAISRYFGASLVHAQTLAFTTMILLEFVRVHIIRSEQRLGFFTNSWLLAAFAITFVLQLLLLYTPLSRIFGVTSVTISEWFLLVGVTLIVLGKTMFIQHIRTRYAT